MSKVPAFVGSSLVFICSFVISNAICVSSCSFACVVQPFCNCVICFYLNILCSQTVDEVF